jgi:uncharacterized protein (DUF58 family)
MTPEATGRIVITALGRWVLAAGLAATVIGLRWGWSEFLGTGLTLLAALLVALPWTIGRGPEHISLTLEPTRVSAGDPAQARITSAARPAGRIRGLRIELPIGDPVTISAVDLPAAGPGQSLQREIALPTDRRAVLDVGPAQAVRADPLGLTRRAVATGEQHRLYVWPQLTRVPLIGSGLLRDLEGLSTSHPSPADIAFHALREYGPGDDRRHVHWRTSARLGQLMVRQFVDTRRSELTLLIGLDGAEYPDPDDFETAVSVIASIAARALADRVSLQIRAGERRLACGSRVQALDALAGLRWQPPGSTAPGSSTAALLRSLSPSSTGDVIVLLGPGSALPQVAASAARLPSAVVTGIQIFPGDTIARTGSGAMRVLRLSRLRDLARLMQLAGAG